MSTVPGGYEACTTVNGSPYCDSYTGWVTGAAGSITDLDIDGPLIAPRIATCSPAAGSQLAITDVIAYWPANGANFVEVDYEARNVSSHVFGNGKPAWLNFFQPTSGGQIQAEGSGSIYPRALQPGASAVEAIAFDNIQTSTGTLTLRTNDQHRSVIASCTLSTP